MRLKRSSYYYEAHPRDDSYERKALKDAAEKRRRWGCELLWAYLRREGIPMNHKKAERLYSEEGLQLHKRQRKNRQKWRAEPISLPVQANERWSMDFVADRLVNGRKLRMLNIVDDFTRECLWIEVGPSLGGQQVVQALDFYCISVGNPKSSSQIMAQSLEAEYLINGLMSIKYICTLLILANRFKMPL